MKETRFIAQNKEKWKESENLLEDSVKDPEKLSSLFTQVIDDLSYSRTYYPNRSVRVYLNKIAREYFSHIYSHQKRRRNTFRHFWLDELPQIVYDSRRALLLSLIIFLASAAIGIFSAMNDPQFASTILSEGYVAMTKANIEKGDPMAVYKEGHQIDMFLGITFNNLMVAFRTYVFGIFLSIGTIAILLYNGIMVGCFQFFFVERGLFAESALAIWMHGTLEISSIILAGGAGLTLGSGLLFPGTYSRLQAFQITAMRSLKLMLGISPIFVLAAIIESFLTRYTDIPDALRLILILLSAFFILGYFVYYPWVKSRTGFDRPLPEVKLPPSIEEPVSIVRIKNNAEILKDTFIFYKRSGPKLLRWIALITVAMVVVEMLAQEPRAEIDYLIDMWQSLFGNLYYALETNSLMFLGINVAGSSLIIYLVFALIDREARGTGPMMDWQSLLQTVIIVLIFYGMLYTLGGWGIVLAVVTYLLFLVLSFCQVTERDNLVNALWWTWKVISEGFGQVMGLLFILLMMSFSFLLVLSAPLLYMNTTILQWNFAETDIWSRNIVNFIEIFLKLFAFNLVIPVFAISAAYLYFSLKEVFTADNLKKSIGAIGSAHSKDIRA